MPLFYVHRCQSDGVQDCIAADARMRPCTTRVGHCAVRLLHGTLTTTWLMLVRYTRMVAALLFLPASTRRIAPNVSSKDVGRSLGACDGSACVTTLIGSGLCPHSDTETGSGQRQPGRDADRVRGACRFALGAGDVRLRKRRMSCWVVVWSGGRDSNSRPSAWNGYPMSALCLRPGDIKRQKQEGERRIRHSTTQTARRLAAPAYAP